MNTPEEKNPVRLDIMRAISRGDIRMRPRWHFVLLSTLYITGAFIVFLALLYITSLSVFFLRDSGALFAPSLGARGWFSLLQSLPWLLIVLMLLFVGVLELLVRRYAFVYKKPLLLSVLCVLGVIFLGGFFIAPLHHGVMLSVRRGEMPAPIVLLYRGPLRSPPPSDTYHGEIVALTSAGFVMADEDHGTTTVTITPQTRLPYGENFTAGERVVVIGDSGATGTVQAFGIREIDEYNDTQ